MRPRVYPPQDADGLKTEPVPMLGPTAQLPSGTDCGDISWVVPMTRLSFPSNIPNIGRDVGAMEHWRPLRREHYLSSKRAFT